MNKFVETAAEAIHKRDCVSGCEQRATAFDKVLAGVALASLVQHRDDIARALALVDSQVDPPLSGKYGKYADAVLALFKEDA